MIKKADSWVIFIVFAFLLISSLHGCDRNTMNRNGFTHTFENLWKTHINSSDNNGDWGFAQCVDVCNYDAECYPWISGNGKFLLFGSINFNGPPRPGHQGTENWDLYISKWDSIHQCWGREQNMGPAINTLAQERRPSCTWNCDTLYFTRYNKDDDIFMSTYDGTDWTTPIALPGPVNTIFNDMHPAISPDRKRLYFTSDRPEGHGGSDIWVAHWDGYSWSTVENMGPIINTPNEETRPFESYDGQRFYFSNNHGQPRPGISYGGSCDIYVSTQTDSGWGPVRLVAPPVNSDLPACSPCESSDGNEIWFGSEAWEGSRGDEDIWVARKGVSFPPRITHGYGNWIKTGELKNAIYVYDLKESEDGTIYAATACADTVPTGRVFKTIDNGTTWTSCADLPKAMVVYSLIVERDTLYAGTYPYGDVFKSINCGDSWFNTADLPAVTSARSLVRLHNGDILVGTSPYDITNRNRIYRTTNGGSSWTLTGLLDHINPCKFIVQTSNGTIFTGGFGIDSETKIHKSVDNGISWESVTVIPQMECHSDADGFYETENGVLYVSGYIPSHGVREGAGFVYKSTDHGENWTMCTKILRGDGTHSGRVYSIVEDHFGTLYVGMQPAPDSVVFASSNGGDTWYSTGGLDGAFECLCLFRGSDGAIYAGTTPNGDVFKYIPQSPTQMIENRSPIFMKFQLLQNTPNPFNIETKISFEINIKSQVILEIFNIRGQCIKKLVNQDQPAGNYTVTWDGTDDLGSQVTSGVYIYRIEIINEDRIYTEQKKAILIK